MRLSLLSPAALTREQKPLYDDMREGIKSHFGGFVNVRSDGALLGPWNAWLHDPKFGKPVWELVKTMVSSPCLAPAVREIAILVTGAHFRSAYELYAHVLLAEQRGLSDEKLSTIVAGQRPTDLTKPEAVAYDFASALVNGGGPAGIDLQSGGKGIWCERRGGIIVSRWPLLHGLNHPQHL